MGQHAEADLPLVILTGQQARLPSRHRPPGIDIYVDSYTAAWTAPPPPHLPQRRLRPLGDLGVVVLGQLLQRGDGVLGGRADESTSMSTRRRRPLPPPHLPQGGVGAGGELGPTPGKLGYNCVFAN